MAILQGIQGIQGVNDYKSLNWRGEWQGGTTYQIDDIVYYQGISYLAKLQHSNQTPVDNGIYWNKLQIQDVQGIQGISIQSMPLFTTPGQATLFKADNTVAISGATGPGVTTGGGGSFTTTDIEFDYSPHLNAVILELHQLNKTHSEILKALTVLANNSNVMATNLANIADNQTVVAAKQTIIAEKQTSIADDTIRIRNVQERMRNLADTIGITTRSQFDYLHVHSTLKGLELDGQGVGDALRAFASVPSITAVDPPPEVLPPVKQSVLDWKGPWDEEKSYVTSDVVIQNGKSYISLRNNKGSPPGDNQIWKLLDEKSIIESEKPKEMWKGTWSKTKTYPAGSIVSYKPGLELNHINGLEDLEYDSTPARLFRALETVQAYDFSGVIPSNNIDINLEQYWESIEHDIKPDKAATVKLNSVQIIGSMGEIACEENQSALLEIDGPVIVEKVPFNIDHFVQQSKGSYAASVYKAKAQNIMPLYTSNDAYTLSSTHTEEDLDGNMIQVNDVRYGLARYPDYLGLKFWTDQSLSNNWSISSTPLLDAFFTAVDAIPGFNRHLRFDKKFYSGNTGAGFFDEPEDWVATSSSTFYWNSREISNAASITHPAWGAKMNSYAVWEAPGIYNPIIRPISEDNGTYNINVGKAIRISILGGPPNSTVAITKKANVNNFFYVGYIANTLLTGNVSLDATGSFVDTPQVLQNTGTITYTATFQNQYTILNGYTKNYIVNVGTNYPDPSIPSRVEDYLQVDYDTVNKLNVGYEFTREVTINFPHDGIYVFQAWTDNWGKITFDGVKILDFNNNFHNSTGPATYGTKVKKGDHVVKLFCINYGAQTAGNPGGIGLTITSGGGGIIKNHSGSKRYKIKTTNQTNIFKMINLDGTDVITTYGSAEGYLFYVEKKMPNPNISEIEFKGCWESATVYKIHEKVLHNELTWIAIKENSNNEPLPDSRYWREITTEDAAFIDDPPLWKGAWNDETTYVQNSIVSYKDKSWIAQKLIQNVPKPPPPDLAGTDWKVVDDPAIHCEAPEAGAIEPPPAVIPEDSTLNYQGEFDPTKPYYSYDVLDTTGDDLIFADLPRIIDFEPIDSIVIKEEEPAYDEYSDLIPYEVGAVVTFDPEGDLGEGYYLCVKPALPDASFNPDNNPESWARLYPDTQPEDFEYGLNDIVPFIPPGSINKVAYIALKPTTSRPFIYSDPDGDGVDTLERSPDWAEIDNTSVGTNNNIGLKFASIDSLDNTNLFKSVRDYVAGLNLNFVGEWDWRTYYNISDVVVFCGVLFEAKENSIGAVPPYNIINIPDTLYPETKWIKLEIIVNT